MKTEWNVPIYSFLAALAPTIRAILSFISFAALLVKVRARILSGAHPFWSIFAILQVSTRVFPEPAPATISTGPAVHSTACFWTGFSPSKILVVPFCISCLLYCFWVAKIANFCVNLRRFVAFGQNCTRNTQNYIYNVKQHLFEKGSEYSHRRKSGPEHQEGD